ncbi:ankyrin [Mytilinidion resinicola]|uniref:Ankyrin n=1 Tax=Mytilinidion resinicola TaxID=574789 RepID=A0A6A6YI96_9PEZI|nr:ankyrin [Mytilinidion resinicola]KAF2808521.1 ankyrin [Mytilinidion resinicola]
MSLLDLANELLQCISENLELEREINAFAQANRRLYSLLNSYLYRYNVQCSASSALVWTAQYGQEATARRLLAEGANIEATGKYDRTPLVWAAKEGHEGIVKLLLDKGADVNAQGEHFGNALQAASEGGHEAIVKLLVDKGANINAQGGEYATHSRRLQREATNRW